MLRYVSALEREASVRADELSVHAANGINTLYIGGGTPSVLPLSLLERTVKAVEQYKGTGWDEFTVEVNPDDIVKGGPEYVAGLRALGVSRVSMGVQSLDDRVLKWMNRRHSSDDAVKAFGMLRSGGFDNISLDLISGFAGFDRESVKRLVELRPEHISAYQLSVEEGSALDEMVSDGRFVEASQEECAGQYEYVCRVLSEAGYVHYEISNFALPDRDAMHNSGYWSHVPYVGLGPAAHSFDGTVRSWNPSDVEKYIRGAQRDSETLDQARLDLETMMLGLRTSRGVDASFLRARCDSRALENELSSGHLELSRDMSNFRIPERFFFISDNIIKNLI